MIIYINHTDGSKAIIKCRAYEELDQSLKVFTDYGYKYIRKFDYFFPGADYMPGIESYQCDSQHAVYIKQPEV